MSPSRYAPYPAPRVILHWVSAAVILWATVSGFLAASLPPASAARGLIGAINPQLTTLFIPVFAVRLIFYAFSRPWRAPGHERLAAAGHAALYGCIAAVLASGVLMMPHAWRLLGLVPMPVLALAPQPMQLLAWGHRALCTCLALLIGGHVLMVWVHHINGRPVLGRMRLSAAPARPEATEETNVPGRKRPGTQAFVRASRASSV